MRSNIHKQYLPSTKDIKANNVNYWERNTTG